MSLSHTAGDTMVVALVVGVLGLTFCTYIACETIARSWKFKRFVRDLKREIEQEHHLDHHN